MHLHENIAYKPAGGARRSARATPRSRPGCSPRACGVLRAPASLRTPEHVQYSVKFGKYSTVLKFEVYCAVL